MVGCYIEERASRSLLIDNSIDRTVHIIISLDKKEFNPVKGVGGCIFWNLHSAVGRPGTDVVMRAI